MKDKKLLDLFEVSGAIQTGHFKLVSGLHSPKYFQCAKVFSDPSKANYIFKEFYHKFKNEDIDYVIGIEETGSILSFEVAKLLNANVVFAKRDNDSIRIFNGFKINKNTKGLILDDVTTTGGTIKKLIDLILDNQSLVGGIGLIATKDLKKIKFPYKTIILTELDKMPIYEPSKCPNCLRGEELTG